MNELQELLHSSTEGEYERGYIRQVDRGADSVHERSCALLCVVSPLTLCRMERSVACVTLCVNIAHSSVRSFSSSCVQEVERRFALLCVASPLTV